MNLLASYVSLTVRQGYNYVNQTRELRLLAAIGILVYVLCSLVMGFTFANSMSQKLHENAPEVFAAWMNRRVAWGIGFIAVVTLLATIATLFQSAQRDELERLRLLPIPDLPFFSMRVLDICMGVFLFFPLLVMRPILRFCAIEGLSMAHGTALFLGIVLVTLQICFAHMALAVAAARLVPERMVQNKGVLYVALAALGAIFFGIAIAFGRRTGGSGLLGAVEDALPGVVLLHSIREDGVSVWLYLLKTAVVTALLGAVSFWIYRRFYLGPFDLLMDKLVSEEKVVEGRLSTAERLAQGAGPAIRTAARRLLHPDTGGDLALALVRKELRSLLRDPSVHLAIFFALLFLALPGMFFAARDPVLGLQVTYFLTVGTLLVFNAVMAVSSVGREGLGLGLITVLPVRTDAVLFAKACSSFILHVLISLALGAGALLLPLEATTRLIAAPALAAASTLVGAVLVFLAVGVGAIFPKFDSKNQFLAVNRFGVAVFFGLLTLLLVSSAGAFAFPVLFGPTYLLVPVVLLGLWAYTAGVLYLEGSRHLKQLMAIV